MGVRNQNSTNYVHPDEPNLLNLHKSMQYNNAGEPVIRAHIDGITLEGDVIVSDVTINNTTENPVPVTIQNECLGIQNCGDSVLNIAGAVTQGTDPWVISGNSTPNGPNNEIFVKVTNEVLTIAGNVSIIVGEDPVSADNPVPVTIPGCVSIQNCGEGSLSIQGQVELVLEGQTVSDTNPLPVTGTFEVSGGNVTTTIAGTNLDAFGRIRTSDAFTLFDSNFRYADDTDSWNHTTTGSGSSVSYDNTTKTVNLTVSGINDEVIRETTKVFQYQPGKSLLIMTTFSMAADLSAEIEQRVGYFGARNGVYFQTIGNQYSLVIRKDISGTVDSATEKFLQSAWNGDRLTGAGGANNASGHRLDPTITQIFWMDIEWLGVGSVRCGFVINGEFIVCHTFHHANNSTLSLTGPYMATASLPIRYEIKRVSGEGTAILKQICSTVISEGGYQPKATIDTASMGVTTKNLSTAGTFYPLVSIRLNSLRLDAIVRLATLQSMITTASSAPKNCFYKILKNATLSGGTWTTHSKGTVDYNLTLSSVTNGTVIASGYFSASTRAEISGISDIHYQLGRTIGGVSDTFTVVVTPDTNNLDVAIDLGWFDLSL